MTDPCIKEGELGQITAILEKISKEVYGNGGEGLSRTIPRLEEKINNLIGTTAGHTNTIANLVSFQASHQGVERSKKEIEESERIASELARKLKSDKRQFVFWIIAAIVGITSVWATLYFGFVNKKTSDDIKSETKVTNDILAPGTRGQYYNPFAKDSIK